MIEVLSDEVLLNIFRHYLDSSAPFWFTLAHTLDCWPPLPLVMNYGGLPMRRPPTPEDKDNIVAALEQPDRVHSIRLTLSISLLKKLSIISEPRSELEDLVLLSQDNVQLTLPSAFWWGHRLRTLHSTGIAFFSLPQILSPPQNLVDLQLYEIPGVEYFPPEAFVYVRDDPT
ncbi:hypothetical protein BJY52DRAFT_1419682 [Lactarius psammicola]|nr:hypothetical protein BJY52DRAFT_1419682 [Lactarius psammicola]